ncbi:MAG: C4-dicarboxylate ABC transporter, partial [Planctomycetota bacterium]
MVENTEKSQATDAELEAMIAATDTGARNPEGSVGKLIVVTAFCWSLFQLWIASPLPYLDIISSWLPVLNNTDTRSIHLAFAISLAFLAYPALKSSPREMIPIQDWILALGGIVVTMYLSVFAVQLGNRPGLPTTTDLVIAG